MILSNGCNNLGYKVNKTCCMKKLIPEYFTMNIHVGRVIPSADPFRVKIGLGKVFNIIHFVSLALTGTYLFSGGHECTLVQWQYNSKHKDFMPRLGNAITHIACAPNGQLRALSLRNNCKYTNAQFEAYFVLVV